MLKEVLDSPFFAFEGFFFYEEDLVRVFFLGFLGGTEEIGSIIL